MKLQMALDDITLDDALKRIEEVQKFIDIVEVGTPMVIEYGMEPVRIIKKTFPDLEVLADLKIMDAGYYESKEAFEAGADYITVLGVTDDLTIEGCVKAAKEYGKETVVDMICVSDLEKRINRLEELGVDYVSVHTGVDQQAAGVTPLDQCRQMMNCVKTAKVSVAGGINTDTICLYKDLDPDIVIVGGGITHAADPVSAAKTLHRVIRG